MKKILLATLIGFVLAVSLYALAALFSGGGHDLTAITAFFPYSLSLGILTKDTRWDRTGGVIAMALLALQFPLYAIILAAIKRGRLKAIALLILLALHVLAVLNGLRIYNRSRPNYSCGAIQQFVGPERG
jgi:hypothetical protein